MSKKKNSRNAAATAKRETGSAACAALSPEENDTTEEKENQVFPIADLLRRGEENAISSRMLLQISGIPSKRELSSEIERERLGGALILSSSKRGCGYFLPSEGEKGITEMRRFYNSCSARAKSTYCSLRFIRRAIKEYEAGAEGEE